MGKLTSYNKGSVFNIDMTDRVWVKLEDLYNEDGEGTIYQIEGMFINRKSKFGPRPFVAFDGNRLVDFPQHMTATIEDAISDPEVVEEINAGKSGFSVGTYNPKDFPDRECYKVIFEDIK